MKKNKGLIGLPEWWETYWKDMPEFIQEDQQPWKTVQISFDQWDDVQKFADKVGQKITDKTKFIWYPKSTSANLLAKKCIGKGLVPKYPIYIPSKGRWESRLTSKALENINVPYYIVVEPQEYDNYAAVIDPAKILVLPWSKPNSNTELVKTRNWIWEHSISIGAKRHWQIDDNIRCFYRLNKNIKYRVTSGTIFRVIEDFVDRYSNIAQAGMQYELLTPRKVKVSPFYLNTRIYSCTLNLNSLSYRYRGIYNDDTDISLRILKDGWCTVLFNAFLADKTATMVIKGGNTPIYQKNGRLAMAQSLEEQHPDVTRVTTKWGRYQHQVNYQPFKKPLHYLGIEKNRLKLKQGIIIPDRVNNYGMELIDEEELSRTSEPIPIRKPFK